MRIPFVTLLSTVLLWIPSCKKGEYVRPYTRTPAYFKFKIIDINTYCKDYRGRTAVKLKCIEYPTEVVGHTLLYLKRDSIFMSTTVPRDVIQSEKEFSAEVEIYVDWQEKAWCQSMGFQINVNNVQ